MKLLAVLLIAALLAASASISYEKFVRELQGGTPNDQAYFVVDETIWANARRDLGDVRLDPGDHEVPYALEVERGSSQTQTVSVPVLQPGTLAGKTQFFLDMSKLAQYDHVELQLKKQTSNLVVHVDVAGADDLHSNPWSHLAQSVIYDLAADNLGSNTQVRLPLSAYHYLRVMADSTLQPAFIAGAQGFMRQEEKAVWRTLPARMERKEDGPDTVLTFTPPKNAPIDRVELTIDAAQPNFRRPVEVFGSKDEPVASGEVSRVHMVRDGRKIDFEQAAIALNGLAPESARMVIHNGDDRPLAIAQADLQQYERRIYFAVPAGAAAMPHVYYGDDKLEPPIYDYAKTFQKDPQAVQISLGPQLANPAYRGRPDDRPWSERHPVVLWIAIIAAVLVLGAVALRSMKTTAAAG